MKKLVRQKVPLIMLAYQHGLAGDVAEEAGHQHQITSIPWILTNVCSTSERQNYFVHIQTKNLC